MKCWSTASTVYKQHERNLLQRSSFPVRPQRVQVEPHWFQTDLLLWKTANSKLSISDSDSSLTPLDEHVVTYMSSLQVPVVGSGHEPGGERQGEDGGGGPSLL